ncbi:hypothetical protein PCC7418_0100 [Halothece sp. PCC 7418]|uniref:hypothetical protein n=1 Tax=Halothece sp. (strain PCC 7418) TaxID=65093 RepID=UPI0002A07ADD|nr:hypothetical protein [Halothece sp. PCC 7418]AFZ42348.1 hypothetical protein PCC7418_0100 [Halothece sp. PCC 7418]
MKSNFNLDNDTLEKLIVEVDRAAQNQENKLDRAEVETILKELNLPPELLDEAMEQVRRREALQKQQKRNIKIGMGVAVLLLGIIATVAFRSFNQQQALAKIETVRDRITLQQDQGENLDRISPKNNPLVYYRVTLKNAPTGQKLALKCDWINPDGEIVHQNNYRTNQVIDKPIWETYCKKQFGSASLAGEWEVKMRLGNDRAIANETFTVGVNDR